MLVKMTTEVGVNFANILLAAFLYLSVLRSFSLITVLLSILFFWLKNILTKADH